MSIIIGVALSMFILLLMHELAHIVMAKLICAKIDSVGFFPHPYVAIENPKTLINKILYLAAGLMSTLTLFLICYCSELLSYTPIYFAFIFQLILETNPFYSDLTILGNIIKSNYRFSLVWFLHFSTWFIFSSFFIKYNLS